jgi:hypothetical protein
MNKHQKFLEFNGKIIVFLNVDGTYWIPLKPILQALNLDERRWLQKTRRDAFFGGCLLNMSIQVADNGQNQARKMTCLPEKYIYGWICFLNADNEELIAYKKTCYELLYNHFHGTITNRKELLLERTDFERQIGVLKQSMKEQNESYQQLRELENRKKTVSTQLNSIDKELIKQPELFNNQ